MPGALPVINKKAVEYAVKAGLALHCTIAEYSKLDRKNYFYPDLPKAYQISQYDLPLCKGGYLDITVQGKEKRIRIKRIHLEEDAGKLIHDRSKTDTLIDYNRCGVPLIEIVTEPDISSPEEARVFLEKLKSVLEYIEVSDCKMQEGSLRCDVNLSIRPSGQKELGVRTELKNLNSFRSAYRAMEYEIQRQRNILESGEPIVQETRRWDDSRGKSFPMRGKEEVHDYRYFPEPDLIPIVLDRKWIEVIKNHLPEMPDQRKKRFTEQYSIPEYDADILTSSKYLADFFETCSTKYDNPKTVSNWLMGDFMRLMNERGKEFHEIPIKPDSLVELLRLMDEGVINGSTAKKVIEEMFETGDEPKKIVEEKGLAQISDKDQLESMVQRILRENSKAVADYKSGKRKAFASLVGQVMKAFKGKANPQMVIEILNEEINRI